jgi:hypothetical protein
MQSNRFLARPSYTLPGSKSRQFLCLGWLVNYGSSWPPRQRDAVMRGFAIAAWPERDAPMQARSGSEPLQPGGVIYRLGSIKDRTSFKAALPDVMPLETGGHARVGYRSLAQRNPSVVRRNSVVQKNL